MAEASGEEASPGAKNGTKKKGSSARRVLGQLLSDANVAKDSRLQSLLKEGGIPLEVVMHKMRKVTEDESAVVAALSEEMELTADRRVRRRNFSEEVAGLIARAPSTVDRRSVEVKNATRPLRELFERAEEIREPDVVVFATELAAISAVETMNDPTNWRSGLRVSLKSGQTPSAARRSAGLPCSRERGRLAYLKVGKYGFIKPVRAKSKDENYFFVLSELNPRDTKLKIGDYLEYSPDLVLRDGEEKKQAKDVRKLDPQPAPKEDAAAARKEKEDPPLPPEERPSRLRATNNHHRERERVAKGPTKNSIGFTRPRPSLSKLRVQARDFVPARLRSDDDDDDDDDEEERVRLTDFYEAD
mmetsp:Transcript_9309/g.29607  ORF Transcript_9309/g.29607 Transcript_9309/m.29607 type:complete len:359 (-) Transcript_9309:332-1408(-)